MGRKKEEEKGRGGFRLLWSKTVCDNRHGACNVGLLMSDLGDVDYMYFLANTAKTVHLLFHLAKSQSANTCTARCIVRVRRRTPSLYICNRTAAARAPRQQAHRSYRTHTPLVNQLPVTHYENTVS